MRHVIFFVGICCSLLAACAVPPLAPTTDVARVTQLKSGFTRAEVETIMGRRGAVVGYSTRPGETTQVWPYADHFQDLCLFVTYDKEGKIAEIASVEREKEPNRAPLPGGCR